jgi:hypothetical protein
MVLTVSFVLSPATGLVATVAPEKPLASRELDASVGASGPHDFAVRISTARGDTPASTAAPPHVRDVANAPSRDGMTATGK